MSAVKRLTKDDALALSDLMAAYTTETRRGPPRVPDRLYAEQMMGQPGLEFYGAFEGDALKAYAAVLELPVVSTGETKAQIEDIFVDVRARRAGHAKALLEALRAKGREKGWTELRWTVPYNSLSGEAFSKSLEETKLGVPARERQFVLDLEPDA